MPSLLMASLLKVILSQLRKPHPLNVLNPESYSHFPCSPICPLLSSCDRHIILPQVWIFCLLTSDLLMCSSQPFPSELPLIVDYQSPRLTQLIEAALAKSSTKTIPMLSEQEKTWSYCTKQEDSMSN